MKHVDYRNKELRGMRAFSLESLRSRKHIYQDVFIAFHIKDCKNHAAHLSNCPFGICRLNCSIFRKLDMSISIKK